MWWWLRLICQAGMPGAFALLGGAAPAAAAMSYALTTLDATSFTAASSASSAEAHERDQGPTIRSSEVKLLTPFPAGAG